MSENSKRDAFGLSEPQAGVSRRGVVTAAAWAVPVVSLSMATPALAASGDPVTALTLLFSKPVYTTAPDTQFAGAEAVKITLLDKGNTPVVGATVKLEILPGDDTDTENPDDGSDADNSTPEEEFPTEAWFVNGANKQIETVVTTLADGSYTVPVLAGPGAGVLPITATVVSLPAGVTGKASAESVLRITAIREAWAWGDGGSGALGTGTTKSAKLPVAIAFPATVNSVKSLFVGEHRRAFAIDDQNQVWAWGSDSHGNMFGLSSKERYTPVNITNRFPGTVKQIDGGYYVTYALLENGDVYGWGYNAYDAFFEKTGGTDADTYQKTPIRLNLEKNPTPLPGKIEKIAATRHNAYFLLDNGEVWTWGRNYGYALGRNISGTGVTYTLGPVQGLPAGDPVIDIDARYYGATVVTQSGKVYSWGRNSNGEVGDGSSKDRTTAVPVLGIEGKAVRAYAAWRNAGVVMEDGSAYVWGIGGNYALGNGSTSSTTSSSRLPVRHSFPSPVQSMSFGYQTGHALLANGTIMGWGRNSSGQVGDGAKSAVKTPVAVIGLPNKTLQIAETQYSTYATILGN